MGLAIFCYFYFLHLYVYELLLVPSGYSTLRNGKLQVSITVIHHVCAFGLKTVRTFCVLLFVFWGGGGGGGGGGG